ncbi:phosphopyruvate hydratase [Candidatus Falkowbacteria bacterium HGW-Falkowbacteria-1]|uniref:Enolase n=1 Tax=Candidatus Falkowbacteria bacterium HGW-Falkowbacteria-1 TaxID=2013768 RepID=A0A2N2EAK9_9BACT|nr:MAG: phosphopyruvate hydratase [Candidatus Falkowbacteria bacterium HGW-Falkowbacteria-1]
MSKIKEIKAREILDSRGNPTVEVKVSLDNGLWAKASVPSGASTGVHEAHELRDGDKKRYSGKGVLKAVKNVNSVIAKNLKGEIVFNQEKIDKKMLLLDGTKNKKKLGANAILGVSMAVARVASLAKGQELYEYLAETFDFDKNYKLPTPSFNIFNGGKHADTNLDFQEFMIVPNSNIEKFSEKLRMGSEIFHELGRVLKDAGLDTDVGNEGGYAPNITSTICAIEYIILAAERVGYQPGVDVFLGTDVGSSELYNAKEKKYIFTLDNTKMGAYDLITLYHEWVRKYHMMFIEDGLAEDDWDNWKILSKELGDKIMLIGDDLFVTNEERLKKGIKNKVANSILIKLNQVGTVSETMKTIKLAQKNNYKLMVSHRSGETCDDFIADLSVAVGAEFIKSGSLSRGERLAKYNRLLEIEENLA